MAEGTGDILIGMLPTVVLATVELWTGRPARAHELLRPVRESFLAAGFGPIAATSHGLWSCDIEALIGCERLDEAQLVLDDLSVRARSAGNPNAVAIAERCRGLLLIAGGDRAAALKALEAALAEHAGRPLAPEIARTLLELGTVQRRAKQKTKAKESLEQALAMFESMGAQMWAARVRDELDRIGLRRPSRERRAHAGADTRRRAGARRYEQPRNREHAVHESAKRRGALDQGLPRVRRTLSGAARRGHVSRSGDGRHRGTSRDRRRERVVSPLEHRQQHPEDQPSACRSEVDSVTHADESPARGFDPLHSGNRFLQAATQMRKPRDNHPVALPRLNPLEYLWERLSEGCLFPPMPAPGTRSEPGSHGEPPMLR